MNSHPYLDDEIAMNRELQEQEDHEDADERLLDMTDEDDYEPPFDARVVITHLVTHKG